MVFLNNMENYIVVEHLANTFSEKLAAIISAI